MKVMSASTDLFRLLDDFIPISVLPEPTEPLFLPHGMLKSTETSFRSPFRFAWEDVRCSAPCSICQGWENQLMQEEFSHEKISAKSENLPAHCEPSDLLDDSILDGICSSEELRVERFSIKDSSIPSHWEVQTLSTPYPGGESLYDRAKRYALQQPSWIDRLEEQVWKMGYSPIIYAPFRDVCYTDALCKDGAQQMADEIDKKFLDYLDRVVSISGIDPRRTIADFDPLDDEETLPEHPHARLCREIDEAQWQARWPHKGGCPLCGSDAYVGFASVDCSNGSCVNCQGR